MEKARLGQKDLRERAQVRAGRRDEPLGGDDLAQARDGSRKMITDADVTEFIPFTAIALRTDRFDPLHFFPANSNAVPRLAQARVSEAGHSHSALAQLSPVQHSVPVPLAYIHQTMLFGFPTR